MTQTGGPITVPPRDAAGAIAGLLPPPGGRRVVGITGPVASGKTTIAGEVLDLVGGGVVLSTDDYLPDYACVPAAERDLPERADLALLAKNIDELLERGRTLAPVWSFHEHRRMGTREVGLARGGVLLVEGIHALAEPAAGRLGCRVFVDADREVRRSRFVARDASGERGWSAEESAAFFDGVAEPSFWRNAGAYLARADVVVRE